MYIMNNFRRGVHNGLNLSYPQKAVLWIADNTAPASCVGASLSPSCSVLFLIRETQFNTAVIPLQLTKIAEIKTTNSTKSVNAHSCC